jgi:hypothetical protein
MAQKYLKQNQRLETLPSNITEWIDHARPQVEGKKRNFLVAPFWVPIYNDPHDYIMIMGGRQIFKSTACTDFIAAEATVNPGIQICYVTHDENNLSTFSKQRLKIGTFLVNPVLSKFLRHPGNVREISLKNNSTIYLVTDNYQYRHLEGKSPTLCILDEAQYQDLEHFGKVHQTMMATKGRVKIFGIGGEAGSPYEKLWNETNQMEWHYDDDSWRDKLEFDSKGLVIGEYLRDVLQGRWIPQNPSSEYFIGYHIPQTIFPTIPLTEQDAVEKYKIHPRFSIEYQKRKNSDALFRSHTLGTFYNSPNKPITREMILRCTEPYRYLSLLRPSDVTELKRTFGDEITIGMGVDFGSGLSSVTAIAVVILWKKSNRIQIAFIEKRPPENQLKQAQIITELFKEFSCDIGVGDLGYGANQVKLIQDGGYSVDTGVKYSGVGDDKFYGSRTISDYTKPFQMFDDTIDEHGEQVGRVQIDKTSSIEELIGIISRTMSHNGYKYTKLIIPTKHDYETDFLCNELISISRKDVVTLDKITDPRQKPKKEYNHPPDSVMSLIYSVIALKVVEETKWNWVSA